MNRRDIFGRIAAGLGLAALGGAQRGALAIGRNHIPRGLLFGGLARMGSTRGHVGSGERIDLELPLELLELPQRRPKGLRPRTYTPQRRKLRAEDRRP